MAILLNLVKSLSLSLSLCLYFCLSLCLSVYLSLCLYVSLSLCLSVSLSLCLSVSLSLCLYVPPPPPLATRPADCNQIWQAYADLSGNGSNLNKLTHPTPGGSMGILRGQQFKSSGNVMIGPDNNTFFTPTPLWGLGV